MAGYRKLGRPTDHRKAMLRNMVTSFLEHGKMMSL
jgi:large subunit ribosomal protein L17